MRFNRRIILFSLPVEFRGDIHYCRKSDTSHKYHFEYHIHLSLFREKSAGLSRLPMPLIFCTRHNSFKDCCSYRLSGCPYCFVRIGFSKYGSKFYPAPFVNRLDRTILSPIFPYLFHTLYGSQNRSGQSELRVGIAKC